MTYAIQSCSRFHGNMPPYMENLSPKRLSLLSRATPFTSFLPSDTINTHFIARRVLESPTVKGVLTDHFNKDIASVIRSFLVYDPIGPIENYMVENYAMFSKNRATDSVIKQLPKNLEMISFVNCDVTGIIDLSQLSSHIKTHFYWILAFTDCYLNLHHLDWTTIDKWGLTLSLESCCDLSEMNWKSLKECKNLVGLVFDDAHLGQDVKWGHLPDSVQHISLQGCRLGEVCWKNFTRLSHLEKLFLTNAKEIDKVEWDQLPKSLHTLYLGGYPLDQVDLYALTRFHLKDLRLTGFDLSKGQWPMLLTKSLRTLSLINCKNLDLAKWSEIEPLNVNILNIVGSDPTTVDWKKFPRLGCLIMSSTYFHLMPSQLPSLPLSLTQVCNEKGKLCYLRLCATKPLISTRRI